MFLKINILILSLIIYLIGILLNIYIISIPIQIFFLILFIVIAMSYFNFEIYHPFVWLTPFIFLYNISVIVLDVLNIRATDISTELIFSLYIAIGSYFIYFVLFTKLKRNKALSIKNIKKTIPYKYIKIIYSLLTLIIIFNIFYFFKSGFVSKNEINMHSSGLDIGIIYNIYVFISVLYIIQYLYNTNKMPMKLFIFSFILLLSISLILGERDPLFRFIIMTVFIFYIYTKPSKLKVYIMLFFLILMVPLFGLLKNIATLGIDNRLSNVNLFIKIFEGEFLSSGRNFELLIHKYGQWDYFYGETLIWDFLRSIVPPFIYKIQNPVGWFNQTFLPNVIAEGRGHGFSFLAEGFINFGYIGVFIWYFCLAFLVNILYKRFDKNIINYILYIYFIPIFIYIQRADFSNLFSPLLKQGLLLLFIIYIGNNFFRKRKNL